MNIGSVTADFKQAYNKYQNSKIGKATNVIVGASMIGETATLAKDVFVNSKAHKATKADYLILAGFSLLTALIIGGDILYYKKHKNNETPQQ